MVATIFVNPLQFGRSDDLDRYPRQEEADCAKLLEAAGCDAAVAADAPSDLYPAGFATTVSVAGVSERWDGAARPGHFDGVATVVAKLFIAVQPDVAFFGEKDFQQLAVIRRMVADLGLPVEIDRRADGARCATASPCRRATPICSADERRAGAGPAASAADAAREAIRGGRARSTTRSRRRRAKLEPAGFGPVDYVALVDAATLEPLDVTAKARCG